MTDRLPGAAKVPAFRMGGDRRDLRLDACRGLALWFIFLDHIPNNALAWLTIRNYGFSDTTEVFVFVSGYTCILAYGGALREQGWPTTVTRALRRGWEIYVAFLLLLMAYLALIWVVGRGNEFVDETNTAVFFRNPGAAILRAMVMQYTPVNTDVLPRICRRGRAGNGTSIRWRGRSCSCSAHGMRTREAASCRQSCNRAPR